MTPFATRASLRPRPFILLALLKNLLDLALNYDYHLFTSYGIFEFHICEEGGCFSPKKVAALQTIKNLSPERFIYFDNHNKLVNLI